MLGLKMKILGGETKANAKPVFNMLAIRETYFVKHFYLLFLAGEWSTSKKIVKIQKKRKN